MKVLQVSYIWIPNKQISSNHYYYGRKIIVLTASNPVYYPHLLRPNDHDMGKDKSDSGPFEICFPLIHTIMRMNGHNKHL